MIISKVFLELLIVSRLNEQSSDFDELENECVFTAGNIDFVCNKVITDCFHIIVRDFEVEPKENDIFFIHGTAYANYNVTGYFEDGDNDFTWKYSKCATTESSADFRFEIIIYPTDYDLSISFFI